MEYHSAIKKNVNVPSATTWRDLEGIMLCEISQTAKDKYSVITYMWNLKNKMNEYNKTETDTDRENKLVVTRVEREEGRG